MFWEVLNHCDQIVTLAVNSLHTAVTDNLMMFLSKKELWFPMYAIMVFFVFHRLGFKKGLIVLVSVGLTIAACDQTSNLIKYAVGRLRPCYNQDMLMGGLHVLEGRSSLFGFFSAHSANAFGLAAVTIWGFKNDRRFKYNKYTTFILIWALLVAVSRMFVGKHYFGDILVGGIIGVAYGCLFGFLAKLVIQKFFKEKVVLHAI